MVAESRGYRLGRHSALLLLTATLLLLPLYAATPIADGDYWWHITQGRIIDQTAALPAPASGLHSTDLIPLSEEERLAAERLRGNYWLAQWGMYQLHSLSGEGGIVVLRALIYTLIVAVAARVVWAAGDRWRSIAVALLLGGMLLHYPNERPALLALPLFAGLVLLLELGRLAQSARRRRWHFAAAAPLLLLWANLHPSVLLGVGVAGAYLLDQLQRPRRDDGDLRSLLLLLVALPLPLLNPNGFGLILHSLAVVASGASTNHEFLSPLRAATDHGEWYPRFWIALAATAIAIISSARRMPLAHWLLLPVIALLALSALRHMIFLLLLLPLAARWLPPRATLPLLIAAMAATLSGGIEPPQPQLTASPRLPLQMTGRLSGLPGRLFNYYDWGGYIRWQSGEPVFIDGRNLSLRVSDLYDRMVWVESERIWLDRLAIDRVLMPGLSEFTNEPLPLVASLIADPNWQLVDADAAAILLSRAPHPLSSDQQWHKRLRYRDHLQRRLELHNR